MPYGISKVHFLLKNFVLFCWEASLAVLGPPGFFFWWWLGGHLILKLNLGPYICYTRAIIFELSPWKGNSPFIYCCLVEDAIILEMGLYFLSTISIRFMLIKVVEKQYEKRNKF